MNKKISLCLVSILVIISMIVISPNVIATTSYDSYNRASIEYPSKVDGLKPFQVKLTIINPEIKKYAKEIRTESNCYYFRLLGEGTEYTPAKVTLTQYNILSHQNIVYNGEKEIVLTMINSRASPLEYTGYNETCSFRFFFIPDAKTTTNPPVLKDGTTLNGIEQIAEVDMQSIRSNYSINMNLPSGVTKATYNTQTTIYAGKQGFQSDGIQYTINAQLMRYGYTLDSEGMASYAGSDWKFDPYNVDYKKHFEMSTKVSYEAGNIFDKNSEIKKLDISSFGKIKVVDAYYRTYSSTYSGTGIPKGKVQVTISFHGQAYMYNSFVNYKFEKIVMTESGNENSIISSSEQEFVAMAKSYTITTQPIEELSLTADKAKDEEKIINPVIYGTIADADKNPMPYMKLYINTPNKKFVTSTSKSGDFKITLDGVEIKDGEPLKVRLVASFDYYRDGKNYFDIWFKNSANNRYSIVEVTKTLNVSEQNTELHFVLDGTNDPTVTVSKYITEWNQIKSLSVMYYHFHESVEFALTKLNANIDYKLPVSVYVGNTVGDTLYSPTESEILISLSDSTYSSSNRPKNREYHEFSHHVMYATYGAWPTGRTEANVKNHDGFLNPNTGDSYLEGFAEFMALAISKENGDKTPEIYASFGSLENNYKPWDSNGYLEEFAVASLLWDLYDNKNDKGDNITMSLDDIWKVLKVNRKDFYEYYLAFKQANPTKQKEIDALFIEHGFFANPDVGNKQRDLFEGYRDANNDGNYNVGEFFVDYGANNTNNLKYKQGMSIGKSANYERINRTSAVRVPNAFIKVSDTKVRIYTIKVDFPDSSYGEDYEYQVDVRDGLIYIQPLPSGYLADITITPYSQDYTSQQPYKTTATKLTNDIEKVTNGYISEYDFKLKSTGKNLDAKYYLAGGTEPNYKYEGDLGIIKEKIALDNNSSSDESSKGTSLIWIVVIIIIVIVIVGVIFFKKKKHHHRA